MIRGEKSVLSVLCKFCVDLFSVTGLLSSINFTGSCDVVYHKASPLSQPVTQVRAPASAWHALWTICNILQSVKRMSATGDKRHSKISSKGNFFLFQKKKMFISLSYICIFSIVLKNKKKIIQSSIPFRIQILLLPFLPNLVMRFYRICLFL